MVYDYVITIKKPDYRFVDQVSQLMYFLSLMAMGYFVFQNQHFGVKFLGIMFLLIIGLLVSWVMTIIQRRKNGVAYFRFGLFVSAIGFFAMANIFMGVLYIIAGLLERQVKFPQEVGFSDKEVAFNSFPKKKLKWSELNNVVLKDGVLTIDQKSNKIFQKEIDEQVAPTLEQEFNDYCKERLSRLNG